MNILIVEDDDCLREIYALKFEHNGFEVDTAGDGKKAITILKHKQYDIVLLDIMMPKANGKEVINKNRSQSFLLASNLDKEVMQKLYDSYENVVGFVSKYEMSPKEIVELVKRILCQI